MDLSAIISDAVDELDEKGRLYSDVRGKSENTVKECGRAMQLAHSGRLEDAESLLDSIRPTLLEFSQKSAPNILIAQQEYTEAVALLNFIKGSSVPHYKDLGVSPDSYLLGLADAVGELRREIVEHMRKDDYATATRLFENMSLLYETLLPLRYSNSILPGFRRKLDVARSMVEQCRRDLLMFKISKNI